MYCVIYGTSRDIERNELGIHGPFEDKEKALADAKKTSEIFGFASVVEDPEEDLTTMGGRFIKSFWNKDYWKKFLEVI